MAHANDALKNDSLQVYTTLASSQNALHLLVYYCTIESYFCCVFKYWLSLTFTYDIAFTVSFQFKIYVFSIFSRCYIM